MTYSLDTSDPTAFLHGGGETSAFIAKYDWSSTAVGPLNTWPQSLKTAVGIVLRSSAPMVTLWGPEGVMIYNDAYAALAGDHHPALLGTKVRQAWRNSLEVVDQMMQAGLSGEVFTVRDVEYTVYRAGQPHQVWVDVAYSPILDESGEPAGILANFTDITQRVVAERKAILEQERRRRMFAKGPGFICMLSGPDLIVEFTNEAHDRLFGVYDAVGKPYAEAFPDMVELGAVEVLRHVYETGERYASRAERTVIRKPGGEEEERYLDTVIQPITDEAGATIGLFGEGFDVTVQVRAQAAAKESQRRLSAAIAIARLGAFEWDLEHKIPLMDERAREIYGFGRDENLTFESILGRIDPADRPRATGLRNEIEARRQFEYRINLPDGTSRHIMSISDCVLGSEGEVTRIIGIIADVTERRRAEDRQRLLINELNHRVKNTLATVQSIAAQTLRAAPDTVSARDAFEARLMALAAAHDLLTTESWHGARMADVVTAAMAAFETTRRPQIQWSGPAVWVSAHSALALTMALHELATNAAKYGALSRPEGRVTIRWARTSEEELNLSWIEEGGPRVQPPYRSGFGSRLLQRSLPRELGGQVDFRLEPTGARCEIRFQIGEAARAPVPEPMGL